MQYFQGVFNRGVAVFKIFRFNRDILRYGWPVALTFALGLLLTLFITQRVKESENHLAQARFAQVAHHHLQLVEEMLFSQLRELDALRRFIALEPNLDRNRFEQFTNTDNRFDTAAGWVENVPRSHLDEFLTRMRAEHGPAFALHAPPDSVNLPLASEIRLYPVTYQTSGLSYGFEIGADVRRLPERLAAFDRALATRDAVLLPLQSTREDGEDNTGIMLIAPVFRSGTGQEITERHFGNLRGFVYLQINLGSLIRAAMVSSTGPQGVTGQGGRNIDLQLVGISRHNSPVELYNSLGEGPVPDIRYGQELVLADHIFSATAFPERPQDWISGSTALIVQVSGFFGSALVAGYLSLLMAQRRRAERMVQRRTEELQIANAYRSGLIASAVDVAVIATDTQGIITLFSTGAENLLGYRADTLVGKATPEAIHQPEDFKKWQQRLADQLGHQVSASRVYPAAIEAGQHKSQHWVYLHRNGEPRQVQLTLSTIRNDNNELLGYLSIGVDLTDYVRAMDALAHSDQLLRDLSAEVPGMLYQFVMRRDDYSRYTFVSDGVEKVFEITAAEALNSVKALYDRVHPDDVSNLFKDLYKARDNLTPWVSEFRVQLPEQGIRWLRGEAHHRRTADGTLVSNGYISDITAIKQLEFQLREQATVDPLTKAFNRRHLDAQWQQAVARCRRTGLPLSLIMLDIDRFKSINDTYGHDAGDEVLVRLSWLLNHEVRSTDMVYRLGGEEFLVVCEDTDLQGANALAQALLEKLRSSPMPFVGRITASFSVTGVALDEAMDIALKRLDELLYRAKRNGRNQIVSSSPPSDPVLGVARTERFSPRSSDGD